MEEEIHKALFAIGAVLNHDNLKKIGWGRAIRTDKRVHALQNIFECDARTDEIEDVEIFRAKLNAKLPSDIKVLKVTKINKPRDKAFSNKGYSYYLPSFMLIPIKNAYFGNYKQAEQEKR